MLEVVLLESWKVLKTAGEFWKGNKGTVGLLSRKLKGGVREMTLQKQCLMKLMLFYLAQLD